MDEWEGLGGVGGRGWEEWEELGKVGGAGRSEGAGESGRSLDKWVDHFSVIAPEHFLSVRIIKASIQIHT